jgi:predicted Ser/Thr protein kinase
MPFTESQESREGELNPFEAAKARVGSALNAKWHLDALLGVGGMGAVFAATHRNGSRAAVKVLHLEFARESDIRERFLREGKIANRVDHPARVAVIDDDVSDLGEPFLVMELLDGSTLERIIKRAGGTLSADEIFRTFDTVLDLLERCHRVQIVHRDIKPANVFVTRAGHVKVLDFGVARMRDPGTEATRAGTALGTPSFMAPEQALGLDAADGRADLWSVGACIFTALTGVRLHKGQTETESFILAATQAAPSIASVGNELPVEIVAFVDKALQFDRTRRFQDAATMRSEMAALRAGLAQGQLTSGAQKKQTGVVVRGNEIIEEGDWTDESRSQAYERMLAIWKNLGLALQGVRQYGWNHPTTTKGLQAAHEDIVRSLAQAPHSVRWEVTSTNFTYDDKLLWQPDRAPLDQIPFQLFRDGIRRVQLKPGLMESELRDFAAILMRDLSSGLGAEDDSVTALWDRRFEHIAYLAIDSFAEGDPDEQAAFQSECEDLAGIALEHSQIDLDWEDGGLEGRAMERNLAGALREAGDAASEIAVDPLTRTTLGAQLVLTADKWRERYVDAFIDGYLDSSDRGDSSLLTDALREWATDQVALRNGGAAFELEGAILRAFTARLGDAPTRAIEPAISAVMFPAETLRAILAELTKAGRDVEQALAAPPSQAVIDGVARALELSPDDGLFAEACACYETLRFERVREAALAYVQRWARGHEADLGVMLPTVGAPLALEIVRLLASLKSTTAMTALEAAFKSPHIRVRIEALAHMPEAPAEMVRDELTKLLTDPAAAVRLEALRMVVKLNVVAAGPALVRQIQADEFHALPLPERQEWFEAVFKLNRLRAEALAIEVLNRRQYLFASEAAEQTREIAALSLASSSSPEALEALRGAAKRLGNSQPVREAAARAVAAITARASAPPVKGRGSMPGESKP